MSDISVAFVVDDFDVDSEVSIHLAYDNFDNIVGMERYSDVVTITLTLNVDNLWRAITATVRRLEDILGCKVSVTHVLEAPYMVFRLVEESPGDSLALLKSPNQEFRWQAKQHKDLIVHTRDMVSTEVVMDELPLDMQGKLQQAMSDTTAYKNWETLKQELKNISETAEDL